MADPVIETRKDYPHYLEIPTRWMDVDRYRHVNNVVYYSYFDTVINEYLINEGGLDPDSGDIYCVCAESQCRYLYELSFPEHIDAGLRTGRMGRSSVRYEIGLFRQGNDQPAACGHFVHVFMSRESHRPTPIPDGIRQALERLHK